MKCPKCAAEFPSDTVLCPNCGAFITGTEGASQPPKRQPKLAYAAAVVLLAIIIAALLVKLAFSGKGVTQAGQQIEPSGPAITNAPPPNVAGGPAITNAPTTQAPPPGQPAPPKPAPPQEVLDYLEFVKQIEQVRHRLLSDTARAVALTAESQARSLLDAIDMVMDDSSDSGAPKQVTAVSTELAIRVGHWQELVKHFDKAAAPPACAQFAGSYRAVLTTETASIQKIFIVLNSINWTNIDSVSKANQQLQAMKADPNLQGNIDKAVETADKRLADLSSDLGIAKPFEVKKETGATGSIIGGF